MLAEMEGSEKLQNYANRKYLFATLLIKTAVLKLTQNAASHHSNIQRSHVQK